MRFYPQALRALGLELNTGGSAAGTRVALKADRESAWLVEFSEGHFQKVRAGAIVFHATAQLRHQQTNSPLNHLSFQIDQTSNNFHLKNSSGEWLLSISLSQFDHDVTRNQVVFHRGDLRVGPALAAKLGSDLLRDGVLGTATIRVQLVDPPPVRQKVAGSVPTCDGREPNYRVNYDADPSNDTPVDIRLESIPYIDCVGGCSEHAPLGIAPSAELRNVGPTDVPWFWRLTGPNSHRDPFPGPRNDFKLWQGFIADGGYIPEYSIQHPYLVWSIYRLNDFDVELLGQSALKHGFETINSDCACGSSNVFWAENCGDIYGYFTNIENDFLAPRAELNPTTASWQYENSHFDPDGDLVFNRDHHNSALPLGEQLVIDPARLREPGRYFLQAWYIVRDDRNVYNSLAVQEFAPTLQSGTWLFPRLGDTATGSVLDSWIAEATTKNNGPEQQQQWLTRLCHQADANARCTTSTDGRGNAQLAVKIENLGGGLMRYHYAFLNLDLPLNVTDVRIPMDPLANIVEWQTDDFDDNAVNNWSATVGSQNLIWQAPHPEFGANWDALLWLSLTTDREPRLVDALLFDRNGGSAPITAKTLAPVGDMLIFKDEFDAL